MKKPSVTKLIGLLDKPAIAKWANKIGLQGISLDSYRSKSQQGGTDIHAEIEGWLKNKTPFTNTFHQNQCQSFFEGKEIIAIEKPIEHELFVGRIDLIYKFGGRTWICDIKKDKTTAYLENRLQLAAYSMAEKCDEVALLSVPAFRIVDPRISDIKIYQEIVCNLAKLYQSLDAANETPK